MAMAKRLPFITALLLMGFLLRAHAVTTLPAFNDESLHIRRAERVWTFQDPDLSLTVGKLLTYYWQGIFHPARLDALWMARSVTGLFALLGLATAYSLGRRLFGIRAGLWALFLCALTPFMLFFDRMALSDPLTTALGLLTARLALTAHQRPEHPLWGVGVGVLGALTIFAKLIGLPFLLAPLVWLFLEDEGLRPALRRRWQSIGAAYITCGAILAPFFLRIVYKELIGERITVVEDNLINTRSPLQTIGDNVVQVLGDNLALHSPPLVLVLVLVCIYALSHRSRAHTSLGLLLAGVWGMTIVLGGSLYTRYLQLGVPLFVLLGAGGASLWTGAARRRLWLMNAALLLWALVFALPFAYHLSTDPRQNPYPRKVRWEYFQHFTSGYALMPASASLPALEVGTSGRVPVGGLVGSCHQIRLYLDENGPVALTCPFFGWSGALMPAVADELRERYAQEGVLYLLVEPELAFLRLDVLPFTYEVLARYPRPFNGITVEVWRVTGLRS
jgi:4-amino-4-deoxy-L-arabinose transferase-like glycosyltransferase